MQRMSVSTPEKVMTAYHLSGPVPIKRPVTLPADFPIVEKRAPIGLAVLTVLLVVGVGYAAWHYLPREQSVVAEKVPPVPDRLLASHPTRRPRPRRKPPATSTSAPAPVMPPAQPTQEARPGPATCRPKSGRRAVKRPLRRRHSRRRAHRSRRRSSPPSRRRRRRP